MSKKLNLCLHAGGQLVERAALDDVALPESTDTYHPIPHGLLVDQVRNSLTSAGLEIAHEQFALARDGQRMFGLMQVRGNDDDDYGLVVGARNSHDKSFLAGFTLGSGVFVCDNLAFSGEVTIGRKHTINIERDLPMLINAGVSQLIGKRDKQHVRFEAYKGLELTDHHASDLIVRAFESRVIGPQRIEEVIKQWRHPNHHEFAERNGWRLFNAFTEALKGSALAELPKRTMALHGLLDKECGLMLAV